MLFGGLRRSGVRSGLLFTLAGALLVVVTGNGWSTETESVHHMGDITVSAESESKTIRVTPAETVISPSEINIPGTSQNVSDIALRIPVFDYRGTTDLVPDDDTLFMRRFGSKRFSTAIDGVTIRKTGGRKSSHIVDYALLPPWLFETIEIKPGPHFAGYPGKSIGGVLNLVSKQPEKRNTLKPDTTVASSYGSYNTQNHAIHSSGTAGNIIYDIGYQHYLTDGYLRHTKADIGMVFSRLGCLLPSDGFVSVSTSFTEADRQTTVKNDPGSPETVYDSDYPTVKNTTQIVIPMGQL